jgi:hypothetical protein
MIHSGFEDNYLDKGRKIYNVCINSGIIFHILIQPKTHQNDLLYYMDYRPSEDRSGIFEKVRNQNI